MPHTQISLSRSITVGIKFAWDFQKAIDPNKIPLTLFRTWQFVIQEVFFSGSTDTDMLPQNKYWCAWI